MRPNDASTDRPTWLLGALSRIEAQSSLVYRLKSGSVEHRRATEVLLVLQDCLHAMIEAHAVLDLVRHDQRKGSRGEAGKTTKTIVAEHRSGGFLVRKV